MKINSRVLDELFSQIWKMGVDKMIMKQVLKPFLNKGKLMLSQNVRERRRDRGRYSLMTWFPKACGCTEELVWKKQQRARSTDPQVFKKTVWERKQPLPERCRSLRAARRIRKPFLEKEFRMQRDAYWQTVSSRPESKGCWRGVEDWTRITVI